MIIYTKIRVKMNRISPTSLQQEILLVKGSLQMYLKLLYAYLETFAKLVRRRLHNITKYCILIVRTSFANLIFANRKKRILFCVPDVFN